MLTEIVIEAAVLLPSNMVAVFLLFVAEDSLSLCKDVLTESSHLVLDLGANDACSPSLTFYP